MCEILCLQEQTLIADKFAWCVHDRQEDLQLLWFRLRAVICGSSWAQSFTLS